jgi:3-hydroxyisobutyrate dehydrogenase
VFDAIGSRAVWIGERPGDGHKLKLVANSWVLSLMAATAQSIALAEAFGLDPQQFLGVISGGPLDSAYAQVKAKAMIAGDFAPSFAVSGAVKDSVLIAEAMQAAGCDDRMMQAVHAEFETSARAGHEQEDMAAVVHAFR